MKKEFGSMIAQMQRNIVTALSSARGDNDVLNIRSVVDSVSET